MQERENCEHCKKTGTCHTGTEGRSCAYCIKKSRLVETAEEKIKGIPCASCYGRGTVEPTSLKVQNRLIPALTGLFVLLAFVLIFVFGFWKPDHFTAVLAFCTTLIGSITGYYFGGKKPEVKS